MSRCVRAALLVAVAAAFGGAGAGVHRVTDRCHGTVRRVQRAGEPALRFGRFGVRVDLFGGELFDRSGLGGGDVAIHPCGVGVRLEDRQPVLGVGHLLVELVEGDAGVLHGGGHVGDVLAGVADQTADDREFRRGAGHPFDEPAPCGAGVGVERLHRGRLVLDHPGQRRRPCRLCSPTLWRSRWCVPPRPTPVSRRLA